MQWDDEMMIIINLKFAEILCISYFLITCTHLSQTVKVLEAKLTKLVNIQRKRLLSSLT